MKTATHGPTVHSAIVHISLTVGELTVPVSQLGLDFLITAVPVDHPPTEAEICMSINGREDRWRVYLPEGVRSDKKRTAIGKRP